MKAEIHAHPGSQDGISSIIGIETESKYIRGFSDENANSKLIATAAFNVNEFRIWKYDENESNLSKHIKVDSSLSQGIKFLM